MAHRRGHGGLALGSAARGARPGLRVRHPPLQQIRCESEVVDTWKAEACLDSAHVGLPSQKGSHESRSLADRAAKPPNSEFRRARVAAGDGFEILWGASGQLLDGCRRRAYAEGVPLIVLQKPVEL